MNTIPGLLPGWVDSYDGPSRTCRVRIEGLTDGSETLPVAVFNNPIGDRASDADAKSHTEIYIKPNDPVWLMFEGGDPRFPIIMGYRTPRAGNPVDWRRWKHANIEMTADNELIINAAKVTWNVSGDVIEHVGGNVTTDIGGAQKTDVAGAMESTAATSKHRAATHRLDSQTTIAGGITTTAGVGGIAGNGITMVGPLEIVGGTVTHDGVNIGKTHKHGGVTIGSANTGNPS